MGSTRYLLLGAIFLHLCSSIFSQETCSSGEGYDFDVFNYFIKLPYRSQLKNILMVEGPRLGGNNPSEPCFQFSGRSGINVNNPKVTHEIANSICSKSSVTLYGSVFFKDYEFGGTVLELYHHPNKTFLGLSVCRVNSEVTVTYRHNNVLKYVSFPFKFFTGKYYKVAAILCGNMVKVYVNCTLIGEKIVALPDYCPSTMTGFELVAGSGCLNEELFPCTSGFNGSLQSVGLQSGANGIGKVCPQLKDKAQCPICGSFVTLLREHYTLKQQVQRLRSDLQNCTNSMGTFNCSMGTPKSCTIQNVTISDNSFIKNTEGHVCYCRDGNSHCTNPNLTGQIQLPTEAPPTRAPATQERPKCSEVTYYEHTFTLFKDESRYIYVPDFCLVVTCTAFGSILFNMDSRTQCNTVSTTCSGGDHLPLAVCCNFCSPCANVQCPSNSSCYNSTDIPSGYQCVCDSGLQLSPNGSVCLDINECAISQGEPNSHNCPSDASCVNTHGSFKCQCRSGFELKQDNSNSPQCIDIDECAIGTAECGPHSTCMNTNGNYKCVCDQGYTLIGKHQCVAVCEKPCQNGAECTSPGNCTCVPGFYGAQCQFDINECNDTSLNECRHNRSRCVNTHGGYFCSCQEGFQWDSYRNLCIDVNECTTGIHQCSNSACFNQFGGYLCSCVGKSCQGHCMKDGQIIYNRQSVSIGTDSCDECTCKDSRLSCKRKRCDCNAPDVSLVCCPECHRNACHFRDLVIEQGDYYIDPNDRCIRKKCVEGNNGEYVLQDMSVECPSVAYCPRDKIYTPEGACCPVCQLPVCTVNTPPVNNSCESCTCDGTNWTCTNVSNCPQLDCPQEELIYIPDQCCPVCHSLIVNKLSCPP